MQIDIKKHWIGYDFDRGALTVLQDSSPECLRGKPSESIRYLISDAVLEDELPYVKSTIGKHTAKNTRIGFSQEQINQIENFINLRQIEAKLFGPKELDEFLGKTFAFYYNTK